MSVSDGEKATAANFNASFISRDTDSNTTAKIDLNDADGASGTQITNIQKSINGAHSFSGSAVNGAATQTPSWASDAISGATPNEVVKDRVDVVQAQVETNVTGIATNAVNITENANDIADIRTTQGTSDGDTDLGTFTGSTISDNTSVKGALQELETEVELKEDAANKGIANGYAPLDASARLPVANLPTAAMTFEGMWNASTNSPTLADGTGTAGQKYLVSVAGTQDLGSGPLTFQVGDAVIHDGSIWHKLDTVDQVVSVNGQTGAVSLDTDDITEGANLYNQTHTGEVTGSIALTVDKTVITNKTQVTPATGDFVLISDGDDSDNLKKVSVDDLGGNGGGGAFSLITGNNSNFENTLGDWINYDDGASATPTDDATGGTGGTPTVISIARNTTAANLLNGDAVALISKTAADGQGEGVSVSNLDVPTFFRGKEMQVKFKYKTLSGYVNNFYRVFVIAQDGATPGLRFVLNNNGGDGSLAITPANGAEFTGSVVLPDDVTQIRLAIHATTTDATAFNIAIDDVKIEEITAVNGATITKEESFTPTGAWTTNTTYTGFKKQIGASAEIQVKASLTGAPNATGLIINMPTGWTIDTARLTDASRDAIGIGTIRDDSGENYLCRVRYNSPTAVAVIADDGDGTFSTVTNINPITFAANDYVQVTFTVPVVELESSALVNSSQANFDNLISQMSLSSSQNVLSTTETDILFDTLSAQSKDFGGFNPSTGEFTIKKAGWYDFKGKIRLTSYTLDEQAILRIKRNGVLIPGNAIVEKASSTTPDLKFSGQDYFNVNDVIKLTIDSVADANYFVESANTIFNISARPDFTVFGVTGRPGLTVNNAAPQIFTASGSYSKPDGLLGVIVEVVGGGGAGGGVPATVSTNAAGASGGGGGGYSKKFIAASALAASETVTIGAGGAGVSGAAGNNGGTTSFGAHCSATGGTGGGLTASVNGIAQVDGRSGGNGSGGDINTNGGGTDYGFASGGAGIGLGTGSAGGDAGGIGGGSGRGVARSGAAVPGIAATSFGGGGGGAASGTNNNSAQTGGDGAGGIVIVEEYY